MNVVPAITMQYEDEVKHSKERVSRAEAVMHAYLRRAEYNDDQFKKIQEEVRNARAELIRRLSTSSAGIKITNLKDLA